MLNKLKVSVIVPVYNVELYVEECILSVLNQTYENIELILVNDGSTDSSAAICDDFMLRDNRIKVIHKANGGLSDARNCGIDNSTGDYILFVDSDDVIHIQCIELLLNNISGVDFAFGDLEIYYDQVKFSTIEEYESQQFASRALLGQIYTFRASTLIVAWGKLFKKSLWDDIRFPIGKLHEDEFVIHHLIDKSEFIRFVDVKLYGYRQRAGSIMSNPSAKSVLDRLEAYALRKQFFIDKSMFLEAAAVNNLIAPKLVFSTVPKSHIAWKMVSTKEVLLIKQLPLYVKLIYLVKRYFYRLYLLVQVFRKK